MVPATVGGAVTLVLLVLPGLAFELIRQHRRPGRGDSAFVEISRVLVAGLAIGAITGTVLAVVSLVGPRSVVSLIGLLTTKDWLAQHLLVGAWTAWAYGVLSVTFAALVAALLPGTNPAGRVHTESGWVTAFDRLPRLIRDAGKLDALPVVRLSVRLTDGTVYVGDRAEFSAGLQLEHRELALGGSLACQPAGGATTQPILGWQRVLVDGDKISDIRVQYVAGTATSETPRGERFWLGKLRRACARALRNPSDATWPQLIEAPAVDAAVAARILTAELFIVLSVAAISRVV